jgi:hypothetical protein
MNDLAEAREIIEELVCEERVYGYLRDTNRYVCLECANGAQAADLIHHEDGCTVGRAEKWLAAHKDE